MTSRVRMTSIVLLVVGALLTAEGLTWAADKAVMRPRVPRDQIEAARAVTNYSLPARRSLGRAKRCMKGKPFARCVMGRMGKGWEGISPRGA